MASIKHIEIAGRDGRRLESFYRQLFGWEIQRKQVSGFDYSDIVFEEGPSAGIRHEPDGHPEVVVYVEVRNLERAVHEAKELGAKVRIPPMEYGDLHFALIQDPEGNPIGLTQKPD